MNTEKLTDQLRMENVPHRTAGMSPLKNKPFGGLSAAALKVLALGIMLLDHLWATVIPGNNWMTYVGRIAFPIFAFQIAEGYFHTADKKKYQKRLLIAAVISEIPFNLMTMSSPLFPFHQNVMFTLLLGLRAMDGLELLRRQRTKKALGRCLLRLAACVILSVVGFVDYGLTGLLTILLFYVFRGFPMAWLGQLVGMSLLHMVFFKGQVIPLMPGSIAIELPVQSFALLSLPLIWLYNGKKGRGGKALQYGCYAFYPVHMLLLYFIKRLL